MHLSNNCHNEKNQPNIKHYDQMFNTTSIDSHIDYVNRKLKYLKTESVDFVKVPKSGCKSVVCIGENLCYPSIDNLVVKNFKFENLDLVENIELNIGGSRMDRIYNNDDFFTVLQNLYNISGRFSI